VTPPGVTTANRRVWIFNYYAAPPHLATMFRHIAYAREMTKAGYDVRIFSANTIHNSDMEIDVGDRLYKEVDYDGVRFVHVRTRPYRTNGARRMLELWRFPRTLRRVVRDFEPPVAVIHCAFVPFDLAMARLIRRLRAKHIVEIADLWPASFVAYGLVGSGNPLVRASHVAEHWLYHRADELVFTIEGGKDYIREKGWDRSAFWRVSLDKVHSINQGVDLTEFDALRNIPYADADLDDPGVFKVVYVGSIRTANNLAVIVDAAAELERIPGRTIRFLIYGDGDQRLHLERACRERGIRSVVFKGRIATEHAPSVLARADVNLFQFGSTPLAKYGLSPNKLFMYFASGKPILSTIRPNYDLVERYGAGVSVESTPAAIADGVLRLANAPAMEYQAYAAAARQAAVDYAYPKIAAQMMALLP
jgi:glycosyltransferase involved in cell wall biosynthesis